MDLLDVILSLVVGFFAARWAYMLLHSIAVASCAADHGHREKSLLKCYCPCHRTDANGKRIKP